MKQMNKPREYESDILNEIFDEVTPSELKRVEKRMLLAQKISEGIKAKGWRPIDLAKALDKSPSQITKWLSGTHNFNIDTLFTIEEKLDIKLVATENQKEEVDKEQVVIFNFSVNQEETLPKPKLSDFWLESELNKSMHSSISLSSLAKEEVFNYQNKA